MTKRVVIVDDSELLRDGVRSLLARNDAFELAGEAENAREGLELVAACRPDVVIMDISLVKPAPIW